MLARVDARQLRKDAGIRADTVAAALSVSAVVACLRVGIQAEVRAQVRRRAALGARDRRP